MSSWLARCSSRRCGASVRRRLLPRRPGRYAVESDQPVAFGGKSYEWSQRIDIVAGRNATLELTAGNASIDTGTTPATPGTPSYADASFLTSQWQDTSRRVGEKQTPRVASDNQRFGTVG